MYFVVQVPVMTGLCAAIDLTPTGEACQSMSIPEVGVPKCCRLPPQEKSCRLPVPLEDL